MKSPANQPVGNLPAFAGEVDYAGLQSKEPPQLLVHDAKIMMVDDEVLNMEVLKIHLESEGYKRFVVVSDSRIALEKIKEEKPAVLLLDLVMPDVSGFDILMAIRSDDELRYLPVLVLTSANDSETKLKALHLGATDFLAKPIDSSELVLRMRNTLSALAWQRKMSQSDPLTALPNRLWLIEMLRHRKNKVDNGDATSALVIININKFKSINDSLGPALGNEILIGLSDKMLACFRQGKEQPWRSTDNPGMQLPIVTRLDGDRFAVHLPTVHDGYFEIKYARLLSAFVESLDSPFYIDGQPIHVSVSLGVAMLSQTTSSIEALINNAETAMRYAQTQQNENYAVYSEGMDADARLQLSIENGLHTALEKGEIFLTFQPKVNVKSNQITGAEALVRWQHPDFGLISPVNFIPLAENSGLIVSIGEWVLRESCRQAKCWQDLGYRDFRIAVNVSIRQLHESDFIRKVESALTESGLPAESLMLELTENMIMEHAESNVTKLQALKALGVGISIDDFGTGYSSLSYLQRFPLDQLKIDRSFIMEIKSASSPTPIVKAVISLAHDLGLYVVAEGVETIEQLSHIEALNCDEYQGFLCGKPMIAEEFLVQLNADTRKLA